MKRPRVNQNKDSEMEPLSGWVTSSQSSNSCYRRHHRHRHRHRQHHRLRRRDRISSSGRTLLSRSCFMLLLLIFIPTIDASSKRDPMLTMQQFNQQLDQQQNNIQKRPRQRQRLLSDEEHKPKASPKNAAEQFTIESSPPSSSELIKEKCESVGKCEQCTFSEQKTYEACHDTGRWEKIECVFVEATKMSSSFSTTEDQEEDSESEISSKNIKMRSCKYTEFDEEFAMVRLQIFCFLVASLAIISVKKQKRLSTSLFDQRKQEANAINSKRSSDCIVENDNEIEFTPMTNQKKEMVSLMEINNNEHMEII
mmetsp:Transcript_1566/g.1668  ORF Transcript_1566/g.1668 Transcript_1566/m.1668 type:complete len:310 (+) Transcript_1566:46-975(+)